MTRNCSLDGEAEVKEKNKILPADATQQVTESEWSAEQTLQKLQEMVKNSSFKGLQATCDSSETFIMEKAAFLLFLAHKQRLQDHASVMAKTKEGSMIDLVQGREFT